MAEPIETELSTFEATILPSKEFMLAQNSGDYYRRGWLRQYMSFPESVRDAAAHRLWENLTPAQRKQLKETAEVTFRCGDGHAIKCRAAYAQTTSVICLSLGWGHRPGNSPGSSTSHAPTTIGDFLLALKFYLTSGPCRCNQRELFNFVIDQQRLLLEV